METQAEEPSSRSKRVQDRSTYGNCEKYPAAKNRKLSYKVCLHCNKELNIKIYKEHKRLYIMMQAKEFGVKNLYYWTVTKKSVVVNLVLLMR